MISALAHYAYCPRRCGLIHLEDVFHENVFTLRGRQAHDRAHEPTSRNEEGVRVERALPLWSERLGLTGTADIVELHPNGRVVPVEYKHGASRGQGADAASIQLCAQGLCLEEMMGVVVDQGAIYVHSTRRRREVHLDADLRALTLRAVSEVRGMLSAGNLPPPVNDRRCPNCSLIDACIPAAVARAANAAGRDLWRIPREDL